MPRRTRTAIAAVCLVLTSAVLASCGGRPDGGNPGNPSADTTTTVPATGTGG